jgi:Esterase PHB depolymerase
MLNQDTLREATRLTRAGQLMEATALLQRMFERAPAAPSPAPGRIRLPGRAPPTIDLETSNVGNADRVALVETPAATARRHRPLFDRAKDGIWPGLRGAKHAPASMIEIVPEGAKFIDGTYSNKAGSRTYKLFVPSGYRGQPLPLIVMLHGCTQYPDDFAAGTRMNFIAGEQNCLVVYPAQPSGANPSKCWNWFRATDQRRDEGEPSLIAGITRQVMQDYSVDPKRIFVAGLSAGGAAAAIMGSPTAICTLRSGSIPVSLTVPPPTCPRRSPPCAKGAKPATSQFGACRRSRPSFSMATGMPLCIQTTALRPSNRSLGKSGRKRRCIAGRYPAGMAIPARPTPTANVRSWSTGTFTVPATPGREAARPALIRIRKGRRQRRKCCVSFSSIRSRVSVASPSVRPSEKSRTSRRTRKP